MRTSQQEWFSYPENETSVMSAWEHLLRNGEARSDALRCLIDDSWHRCLQNQVDPGRNCAPPPLDEDRLMQLRLRQERLIQASTQFMAETRDFLSQTGTIIILADPTGTILDVMGDMRIVEPAEEARLIAGCSWAELNCGTNAIGTAIALGQPVQIHGAEHFCAGIKRWTCSATVIRDPIDASMLGVIDISGLAQSFSKHSLALAVSMAGRIENRLARLDIEGRQNLIERCTNHFSSERGDGVLVLDERGYLVRANERAQYALASIGIQKTLNASFRIPELMALREGQTTFSLPEWLRAEWVHPIKEGGRYMGSIVAIPSGRAKPVLKSVTNDVITSNTAASSFSRIAGNHPALRSAVRKAQHLAQAHVPVLLFGETGVGKELFAQGIHGASASASGPFVALNCGSLSKELLASELFGYADGAFTGARKGGMIGKIEAANGGTLFLDEIGEMPLDIQPHLLRVLEEGELYRLGENVPRKVNFRLIAATHRDLRAEIVNNRFRMDLFYRIAVTSIAIPSLRERREDIAVLADQFLETFSERYHIGDVSVDRDVYTCLEAYQWPGNIRELRNAIESALLMAQNGHITLQDIPQEISECANWATRREVTAILAESSEMESGSRGTLENAEIASIRAAMQKTRCNLTQAAETLGIAKSTLYLKLRKYGLIDEVNALRQRLSSSEATR